jgi:hypothetical protein
MLTSWKKFACGSIGRATSECVARLLQDLIGEDLQTRFEVLGAKHVSHFRLNVFKV